MESHLSSDAWPVPWLAALAAVPRVCCVRGCRALSLALCAVPLVPGLPCLLVPWSLYCVGGLCARCPGLLACPVWVGCVRPCAWACPVGCVAGPYFPALYCGLPGGASEKGLYFRPVFSGIFSLDFSPLCAGLYFFWFIFPASRSRIFFSGFFCVEISGEFFRIYFSGFFLALFSRRYLASSFFSM